MQQRCTFITKSSFWQDCAVQFVNDLDAYGWKPVVRIPLRTGPPACCGVRMPARTGNFRDSLYGNINATMQSGFKLNDPFYGDKKYGLPNGIF